MTFYSLYAYLSYRRRAYTRHGVHSPFVFDFIEQVLSRKHTAVFRVQLEQHIGIGNVIWIDDAHPSRWEQAYLQIATRRTEYNVIVFPDVHKTITHAKTWQALHSRSEVRLSIDLYRYGLLFFRKEFREKQHFILRYPA